MAYLSAEVRVNHLMRMFDSGEESLDLAWRETRFMRTRMAEWEAPITPIVRGVSFLAVPNNVRERLDGWSAMSRSRSCGPATGRGMVVGEEPVQ